MKQVGKGKRDMIQREVDASLLKWPSESDIVKEDSFVRGYVDLRGATWEFARDDHLSEERHRTLAQSRLRELQRCNNESKW